MDLTDTCTSLARHVDEPLPGTAPVATGWMAVEVPGAWGRDGLTDSALDTDLAAALAAGAAGHAVRVQSIRRPTRRDARLTSRTVVLAHSGPTSWCEVLEVDDDALARIDPAVCAAPSPPGLGREHTDPVVLVCTHAKRDRCCATLGRPVADTLAALHPGRVWETSHVGGHRFAANLAILPEGLVYGGLDVADAVETVALHLAGRIDVAHLRGRSALDRPSQAVEALARERLDLARSGDLEVVDVAELGDGEVVGLVSTPSGDVRVELGRFTSGVPRRLSCDSDEPEDPPSFELRSLTPVEA